MTQALLRLQSLSFEGAGSYRRLTGPLPLAKLGKVLIVGGEGCLDAETRINFRVDGRYKERDWRGRAQDEKGGTIKRLYERFHKIPVHCGRGRGWDKPVVKDGTVFTVPSMNDEGRIFHNQVVDVVYSGMKQCFRIESEDGCVIVATADHKFFVGNGYLPVSALAVGSQVFIHNNTRFTKDGKTRSTRPAICVKHHPHGHVKMVKDAKTGVLYPFVRIQRSRLVVEASMNGLSNAEYRERLNNGALDGLVFLPPGVHIHHIDECFDNDVISNLMVLQPEEHNRMHAVEQHNNLRFVAVPSRISSITPVGERETYDIKVQGPCNNFVAQKFVVHNSGKSMLPEVPTMVLYGKGSQRIRTTGLVESSIANKDTGYQATLNFESGFGAASRKVSITQAFQHKRLKSRYIITVDGKRDLEPTTKPEARKLVKRLAPLSYDEWMGVVYMPQGAIHDLLVGSPTDKRSYLTSVFGLDFYDDLMVEAAEQRKELAKKTESAFGLEARVKTLEEEIEEQQSILAEVPQGREEVDAGIKKLGERLQRISKDLGRLEAAEEAFGKLENLNTHIEKQSGALLLESREQAAAELEKLAKAREVLVQSRAKVRAALDGLREQKQVYAMAESRVKAAKEALKEAQEALSGAQERLTDAPDADALDAALRVLHAVKPVIGAEAALPAKPLKDAKVQWKDALKEEAHHTSTATKLAKLAKAHASECPTCAAHLDPESVKGTIEACEKNRAAAYKQALGALRRDLKVMLGAWWPEVENLGELLDVIETLLADYQTVIDATDDVEKSTTELRKTTAFLTGLTKPKDEEKLKKEKTDKDTALGAVDDIIDDVKSLLGLYDQQTNLLATVGELSLDDVDKQIADNKTKQNKTKASYEAAMELRSRIDQATATMRSLKRQMKDAEAALDAHGENAAKLQAYDTSLIPYFTTLRASKVRSSISVLEQTLPVYVNTVAEDQYAGAEVRLSTSDDLKTVDLLLRPSGYGPWLSAIQASGGQRQRFCLAMLAALYEVSPRKSNVMWLDEPFTNLESDGKALVLNRLLPTLMDRCPSLESMFVIAHDKEVLEGANDTFDAVWTVSRDEQGSSISMGNKLANVAGR